MAENVELVQRLRRELQSEAASRQRQEEVSHRLQGEYEVLLKRLAESELHIDRLRLGANVDTREDGVQRDGRKGPLDDKGRPPPSPPSPSVEFAERTLANRSRPDAASGLDQKDNNSRVVYTNGGDFDATQISTGSVSQQPDQRHESDIRSTRSLSFLSSDDVTLFSPGEAHHTTDDTSQLSATTITDRASAESTQMVHFFHVHDLQEKIAQLESKLSSDGNGVSLDELQSALSEIQTDHQQLVRDVSRSQEELQALNCHGNGKPSNHIARCQETLEGELSQLAGKLSHLHGLLQSKATSSLRLLRSASTESAAPCSNSSRSSLSCDSLNSPPPLPEKYYSQSHPEDHVTMSCDHSHLDHMMSCDSLARQPSRDSLEPPEPIPQAPPHHPHTSTIDSNATIAQRRLVGPMTVSNGRPLYETRPFSETRRLSETRPRAPCAPRLSSGMTSLLGDGDSGFAGSCMPRPSTMTSYETVMNEDGACGEGGDAGEGGEAGEGGASEERLPTLTIAAIEALRHELAELKIEVMKSSQKHDSSMFHFSGTSETHSHSPVLHSTPVKTPHHASIQSTTAVVTPVSTAGHTTAAAAATTPGSHDQPARSHDPPPSERVHTGVQVVQPTTVTHSQSVQTHSPLPTTSTESTRNKQIRFKSTATNTEQFDRRSSQVQVTTAPEQRYQDTSLRSDLDEADPPHFSVRRHSVPVAPSQTTFPPQHRRAIGRGGEGTTSDLATHRPTGREHQSLASGRYSQASNSSKARHTPEAKRSNRAFRECTPSTDDSEGHTEDYFTSPSVSRFSSVRRYDRVGDLTPNIPAPPRRAFDSSTPTRSKYDYHQPSSHTVAVSKPYSYHHPIRKSGLATFKPRSLHREMPQEDNRGARKQESYSTSRYKHTGSLCSTEDSSDQYYSQPEGHYTTPHGGQLNSRQHYQIKEPARPSSIRAIQRTPSGRSRSNVVRVVSSSPLPRQFSDERLEEYHSEPVVVVTPTSSGIKRRRRGRKGRVAGGGGGGGRVVLVRRPDAVEEVVYLVKGEEEEEEEEGGSGDDSGGDAVLDATTAVELEEACRLARQLERRAQRLKSSLHSEISQYDLAHPSHLY